MDGWMVCWFGVFAGLALSELIASGLLLLRLQSALLVGITTPIWAALD